MGWYDSNGLLYNFDMPVTADMKLKAAWKSNGGSAGASNSQMNSSSSAADMGIADPYMPGSGGTALGGVIASIYQKDNAVRSASLSASLNGGISVLASRAPKTGDTLPPFWLFAILCAAGGILTAVYILTALRRKEHENSASR